MKSTIQVRLPTDTKKRFQAVVDFEGTTVTEMIRTFVESKIEAYSEASKVKTAP